MIHLKSNHLYNEKTSEFGGKLRVPGWFCRDLEMEMVMVNVTLCNKRKRYLSNTEKYGGMNVGGGVSPLAELVFAHSDPLRSPYYNIVLKEIYVAGKQFAQFPGSFDGKHGTILDSGTTYTYLPQAAFKDAMRIPNVLLGHMKSTPRFCRIFHALQHVLWPLLSSRGLLRGVLLNALTGDMPEGACSMQPLGISEFEEQIKLYLSTCKAARVNRMMEQQIKSGLHIKSSCSSSISQNGSNGYQKDRYTFVTPNNNKVSPGAFSKPAALKAYPKCKTEPCDQFEDVLKAVELWLVGKTVLQIENSVGGCVHQTYDLLLRDRLRIVREVKLVVNHFQKREAEESLSHPQEAAKSNSGVAAAISNSNSL